MRRPLTTPGTPEDQRAARRIIRIMLIVYCSLALIVVASVMLKPADTGLVAAEHAANPGRSSVPDAMSSDDRDR